MYKLSLTICALILFDCGFCGFATANPADRASRQQYFQRQLRDGSRVGHFHIDAAHERCHWTVQMAVLTLHNPKNSGRLQICAMMHAAEAGYYESLNTLLKEEEFILYEHMTYDGPKPREALLTTEVMEKYSALTGLVTQRSWQSSLMETEPRWKCIDVSGNEFYDYVEEHGIDLKLTALEKLLSELRNLEEKEQTEATLRFQLVKRIMSEYPGDCCYTRLPEEDRNVVHAFIHTRRDANFLAQVKQSLKEQPDHKISVLVGASHVAPLVSQLVKDTGYSITGICWVDALAAKQPRKEKQAE